MVTMRRSAVELFEEGVEGGGFAGAGGAGDEDDAVRFGEEVADGGLGARGSRPRRSISNFLRAEEAKADGLAFDAGDAATRTSMDWPSSFEVDAAVLGEAAFGDVEVRS
jgi:hypothetical protein